MKRFVFILFAISLTVLFITNGFAASLLNENEQAILDKLKSISSIPAEYVNQAENFFLRDDVDVDPTSMTEAINNIQSAEQIIKENNIVSFNDLKMLKKDDQQKIINNIKNTAKIFGAEAAIDVNKKVALVTYKGATVFESRGVIQKTGFDISVIIFLTISALLATLILKLILTILNNNKATAKG